MVGGKKEKTYERKASKMNARPVFVRLAPELELLLFDLARVGFDKKYFKSMLIQYVLNNIVKQQCVCNWLQIWPLFFTVFAPSFHHTHCRNILLGMV